MNIRSVPATIAPAGTRPGSILLDADLDHDSVRRSFPQPVRATMALAAD